MVTNTVTHECAKVGSGYFPIAIVGIGCRFPGGITNPQTFWEVLSHGRDCTGEVPSDRWSLDSFYDPNPEAFGKTYVKRGGFIDQVDGFDPQFFGISPREAAYMDPQQRLLLEVTWESFEDAGIRPVDWTHRNVGVFVGLFTHDYENLHMRQSEQPLYGPHSATGMSTTIAANRLSHAFDFKGPSMVVDTACSSSLVAVHLACRALQNGEAEIAVAGGVNLQLSPELTITLCKASMLSPDGRCKSFDSRANGYARADGAGMVLLKPLADALADGNDIYGVIQGSAVNQDGRSKGITVPSGESQMAVMRAAIAESGGHAEDITYIEAHGTGTAVGDPIEANALGTVLGDESTERDACTIGSVKSNFGHTESTAGVAGLIKVALMQRYGQIPPNLHFENPNPDIPFDDLNLRIATKLEDWRPGSSGQRLAGVNSFGFGGTNAHAVVAPPPAVGGEGSNSSGSTVAGTHLLCLSARSEAALRALATKHAEFLSSGPGQDLDLDQIASALTHDREHHPFRLAAAVRNHGEAIGLLEAHSRNGKQPGLVSGSTSSAERPKLAFVFSGMGQQWWAMGRGLLEGAPVFSNKIDELDAIFRRFQSDLSVRDILSANEKTSQIDQTEFAQPAIFSVQVALVALLNSMGVRADVVIGHSIGEVAAAHFSGALTLEDAASVCFHRSRLQATLAGRGGMLAVGLAEQQIPEYIDQYDDQVSIAAVNSPNSVTLAGDGLVLEELAHTLEKEGHFARLLNVELPYHSPVMNEIGEPFKQAIAHIAPQAESVPIISTVTGQQADGTSLNAEYWARNICDPVLFAQAMDSLDNLPGPHLVLEIGAHPVLSTSIRECRPTAATSITSLRRKQDDAVTFLSAIGQLHCLGFPLELDDLFARPSRRIGLPTYPWQRTRYWTESDQSRHHRVGQDAEGSTIAHPLLGTRLSAPNPTWLAQIRPELPIYVQDHQVQGAVVFPAAGFAEIALAAAAQLQGAGKQVALEGLKVEAPLILTGNGQANVQMTVDGEQRFEIYARTQSDDANAWRRHANGRLTQTDGPAEPLALMDIADRLQDLYEQSYLYEHLADLGLQYGDHFQALEAVWIGNDEALGRIAPTQDVASETASYIIHPVILDASIQMLAALPGDGTFLPVSMERLEVFTSGQNVAWAHTRVSNRGDTRIVADISLTDAEGQIIAKVAGLTCQLFESDRQSQSVMSGPYLYDRAWVAEPLDQEASNAQRTAPVPSPSDLALDLQTRHDRRISASGHQGYIREALADFDLLAIGYFVDALKDRGWDWPENRPFTSEQLMKHASITGRHGRFVDTMLQHLADAGYLTGDAAGWKVVKQLPDASTLAKSTATILKHPDCHAEARLIDKMGHSLAAALGDEEDLLSTVFASGSTIAENFFEDSRFSQPYNLAFADTLTAVIKGLPNGERLRILEVGGGTGGLTGAILPLLPAGRTDYTFTDASDEHVKHARDRFRAHPFLHYEVFNAEQVGDERDFGPASFDVIVASNTMGGISDLPTALTNLKDLLAPGGLLALAEPTARRPWLDLVFGLVPGWWDAGSQSMLSDHPLPEASAWLQVLKSCGFGDRHAITGANVDGEELQSLLLVQKPPAFDQTGLASVSTALTETAHIVILSNGSDVAKRLSSRLQTSGHPVTVLDLGKSNGHDPYATLKEVIAGGDEAAPLPEIVDLRSLDEPKTTSEDASPADIATAAFQRMQHLVQTLDTGGNNARLGVWLATSNAEAISESDQIMLDQTPLRGFARVLINERPDLKVRMIDLAATPSDAEIEALGNEILAQSPEDDVVLRDDRRFVSRVAASQNLCAANGIDAGYKLERANPLPPIELIFRESMPPSPGPGEVQVQLSASGLNFKDFAIYSGLVDLGGTKLGLEGAGIVTAVGEGVDHLSVGDTVMGLMNNSLSNPINTLARVLTRTPSNLSLEEAAGTPTVFLSAYHALAKQAHLKAGETVLVHTGASGFGLAAIQIARALGATVLTTAGNPDKRAYLKRLGIDYVGDSRSAQFAGEVLEHTDGRGVDVVLNTLPVARNANNIEILRAGTGRLVDLSNVHYGANLDYNALKKGISVSAFDLNSLALNNPDYIHELMVELKAMFESDALRPVPYRVTPLARVAETVEGFKKGTHIGKIIVSLADSVVDMLPGRDDIHLSKDGSYLVTGGLTGFGLSTAKWLASKGAGNLVLVGRRGIDTPGAEEALEAIRACGAEATAISCDISDQQQVKEMIAEFGCTMPPLRGVVHAAVVLRDQPIRGLTEDDIRQVLAPKIDGAWNLHVETRDMPLDLFLLYSSASNLIGNTGQANYVAANAYLEALARMRKADGLPALAIAWGVIGDSGELARNTTTRKVLARQGGLPMDEEKAWAAISYGMRKDIPYVCAAVVDWAKAANAYTTVAESPSFNLQRVGNSTFAEVAMVGGPSAAMEQMSAEERNDVLTRVITEQIADVLGLDPSNLEIDEPLQNMGFDSLMAVELQVAIEKTTGHSLQRMELLSAGLTAADLVCVVSGSPSPSPESMVQPPEDEEIDFSAGPQLQVDDLSDADVDALLNELATAKQL